MEVTLSVKRYDPESERANVYYQDYDLEMEESATVLDALIKIREEIDGTLSLRCSCRSAICGSCAMRINGQAGLACNTMIKNVIKPNDRVIKVDPAGNMNVVKDLVVDFAPFWDKVRDVKPWVQHYGEEPKEEYIVPNQDMLHLAGVMSCIM